MKTIIVGIMPKEKMRERVLAIARGDHKPYPGEPTIWFTSLSSLMTVLNDENSALRKTIVEMLIK